MLDSIPERVGWLVDTSEADLEDEDQPVGEQRFIHSALWDLPGEEGAAWMLRRMRADDIGVNFTYQEMRSGQRPDWPASDWCFRLDALADARLNPPPGLLTVFGLGQTRPPIESARVQARVACAYADRSEDPLLRTIAGNLRTYRTGQPGEDVQLFCWDVPAEQRPALRWLLEQSGPAGSRQELVAEAHASNLIDGAAQTELHATIERAAWMDEEVPWTLERVVDVGVVRVPDGRLAAGDPWWAQEGLPWTVQLEPGAYRMRLAVAWHPLHDPVNAAVELVVDPDAVPTGWQSVESPGGRKGCTFEAVGSYGAATALSDPPDEVFELLEEPDQLDPLFGRGDGHLEIDANGQGNILAFSLGTQHPDCRTWLGLGPDGRIVRVVTDLGILGLDPTQESLPWKKEGHRERSTAVQRPR